MMSETEIEGVVKRVIFSSNDRSYSVLSIDLYDEKGAAVVTVNAPPPTLGEQIVFSGQWVEHPRFGLQFKADGMKMFVPVGKTAIEKYLGSGAIEGLGPAMAKRIVDKFGDKTLDILDTNPERLSEIPGIGAKTMTKVLASYQAEKEFRDLNLWLEDHGISGALTARLLKTYHMTASVIEIITRHPYRLADEVSGIGFATADDIAQKLGMAKDAPERIRAALNYIMRDFNQSGNVCVPRGMLTEKTKELLTVDDEDAVQDALNFAVRRKIFVLQDAGDEGEFIYTDYLYRAECEVAAKLTKLRENTEPLSVSGVKELIHKWERTDGVTLAPNQWEALYGVLEHGVLVLTGGPGTGKTTVIRAIIHLLKTLGETVLLCAPTGRAAKRLQETTGHRAMTVHRLLEVQMTDQGKSIFGRDTDNPLEADVVIVDEFSMMDILLTRSLLAALTNKCRLIMVGDADQLPSVGPGTVLKDILGSGVFPSVRLKNVYRQSGRDDLIAGAHKINAGEMPAYQDELNGEFQFWEVDEQAKVTDVILNLCRIALKDLGYNVLADVQILSPMHRGECGVDKLNLALQAVLNPPDNDKNELRVGTKIFRENDKVMQTKNNYQKSVYNGDIGFIEYIDDEKIGVNFGKDLLVDYKIAEKEYGELESAYAMSVHKSQGSEYNIVILPLLNAHYVMLQRNLLYTAVTRAKEKVIIIGEKKALEIAIGNDRTRKRFTLLKDRLKGKIE